MSRASHNYFWKHKREEQEAKDTAIKWVFGLFALGVTIWAKNKVEAAVTARQKSDHQAAEAALQAEEARRQADAARQAAHVAQSREQEMKRRAQEAEAEAKLQKQRAESAEAELTRSQQPSEKPPPQHQ
jgi:hypothetical protein